MNRIINLNVGTYDIGLDILYSISYYTSNKYTAAHANNAVNTYI